MRFAHMLRPLICTLKWEASMGSGMRMRREQQQMAMQQEGMQSQASSQLSTYNRAVAACMTGRGDTVEETS
jgi:hypothetical protein